jgi:flagellin-like protein
MVNETGEGSMTSANRGRRRLFRRAGVSPIIATLLLLAIVVVLAGVLYVLVSGELRNSSPVPLGTEFYAGPANGGIVGTAASNAYCEKGHYCYSIPIDEAGGGLALGELNFKVLDATGSPHVVSKNFAQVALVTIKNSVVAAAKVSKNGAFVVTSWQTYAAGVSSSTPVSNLQVIWVQFGNTATPPYHNGDTLVVLGTGSFAGDVTVALP